MFSLPSTSLCSHDVLFLCAVVERSLAAGLYVVVREWRREVRVAFATGRSNREAEDMMDVIGKLTRDGTQPE